MITIRVRAWAFAQELALIVALLVLRVILMTPMQFFVAERA